MAIDSYRAVFYKNGVAQTGQVAGGNYSPTDGLFAWPGGRGTFACVNPGATTIKLQMIGPDGSTAIDLGAEATLATTGMFDFELAPCLIKVATSGGSTAGLYAEANRNFD